MDDSTKSLKELRLIAKEQKIKGYSTMKKEEILTRLSSVIPSNQVSSESESVSVPVPHRLDMIDLFAGTGAFTHAFGSTNKVRVVFANDMVEASKKSYDLNFHPLTLKDLNTIKAEEIPHHNILTGGFPCFVSGTKVLTDSGYKCIEDVLLNDKLLTHTGKFQNILNLQRKEGANSIQSIQIMYHPHAIKSTSEHPFYVRERIRKWDNAMRLYTYSFGNPEWIEAKDITENHYSGIPVNAESTIPTINGVVLDNPDEWFMMGYFLGDGWIEESKYSDAPSKNTIHFAINKDDNYIAERIQKVIPITNKNCKSETCETFGCSNEKWHNILNLFGKYSHGKKIPEWVHSAPVELIKEFMDGYNIAGGSIHKTTFHYTTVSENIAFSIQRLYLKLGVFCSIDYTVDPKTCVIEGRTVNQKNTYQMKVTMDSEKQNTSFIENSYAWFKVKSNIVTPVVPQTVYNFEVEYDNSYCVENTIVHNCQPFSIAGKQAGFEDTRSNVFWKLLEIIDHHTPDFVILENVKNLVTHDNGNTFDVIKTQLTTRGYHIRYKVLNTADITDIPQHRERIYLVCIKSKELYDKFSLDFPKVPRKRITDMLEENIPDKYYYTNTSSTWPLVSEAVKKKNTIYQYRRVYVRENKSSVCPTLTANMGGGGHNVPLVLDEKGIRKLTPRECFNFQGFPASYKLPALADSHLYKLAGNAVSVPVVKLIAKRLMSLV